ncbi:MAG: branched-chain amino acid ABC transporter permease [Pseudomonadota bacterium]
MIRIIPWLSLAMMPLIIDEWALAQLAQYLSYGLFAMSLALIWGQAGLLCFGHALYFGLGAYAMSIVTLGLVPGLGGLTSSWVGLVLAMIIPAGVAGLLGAWLFRGRSVRGAYFGIITLALAVIAERAATSWDYLGGLNGLIGVPPFDAAPFEPVFEIFDPILVFFSTLAVCALVYWALVKLLQSPWGLVLRALRDQEDRVAFLGFDTARLKTEAFMIAGAMAGLAGALFVTQFGFASPSLIGFALSTEVLVWVALGGRGLLMASFLGAILVRYFEGFLGDILGPYWLLGLGFAFVAVVLFLPRGLLAEPYFLITRAQSRTSGATASDPSAQGFVSRPEDKPPAMR